MKKTMNKTVKNNMINYGIVIALFVIVQILSGTGHLSRLLTGLLVPLCVYVIAAISLNLVVGFSGELSLGHAGFMCVGAYSSALFSHIASDIPQVPRFILAILIGAAILLFTGVASWRTMSFVFIGGLAMGYFFQALGVTTYPAWEHLIVGGFAFGAVFMATDPVTSAQTRTGQYIVGFLTGALAVLIRVVNPAYPEGMMLAILFMNALAPLVDYCVVESSISRRKKRVKLVK